MKRILSFLLNRVVIVAFLLLIQIAVLVFVIWRLNRYFLYFYGVSVVLSLVVVLAIINDDRTKAGYKLAWIIPILVIPIFGLLFYMIFGRSIASRTHLRQIHEAEQSLSSQALQNGVLEEIAEISVTAGNQSRYISRYAGYAPYKSTYTEYLYLGEVKFECLKAELKKAKRYIFLEYFIIEEGVMWDAVLEILTQKANQGVDVRVIYDDIGCSFTLPLGYDKKLRSLGIKCQVFNPLVPVLSSRFNTRDHRKIVVIDGHTGFTGGINMADEYINAYEKYGHWKDTAVMLKGEAVFSFTTMFLSQWNFIAGTSEEPESLRPDPEDMGDYASGSGYVQPFSDTPLDGEAVSETIYLNIINKAERYVYINTPYLIIGNEMMNALCVAAKNGIDVRIITPHKPDKWYVHSVTRSYYPTLLDAGVKIYEYTPGFMHAKSFVADDKFGVIGTVNLDYRSLYLHMECGVWLYEADSIRDMYDDYLETLERCEPVLLSDCLAVAWYRKLGRMLLRSFAPLM